MEETSKVPSICGTNNRIVMNCSDTAQSKISITINGNNNQIIIENFVEVSDLLKIYIVDDNSIVHIGRGTSFEEAEIVSADNNNQIIIGEDCMFARETKIFASDFHSIVNMATGKRKNVVHGVKIDNHVWVAYGSLILKNTHIWSNSIVGAKSTVTGNVLPNRVYPSKEDSQTELTWERKRQDSFLQNASPILDQSIFPKKIDEIDDIVCSIEDLAIPYFNKIKGWIFWANMNSYNTKAYLKYEFDWGEKSFIVNLPLLERTDVAEVYGNSCLIFCGFDSYMPSTVITNAESITKVELLLSNLSRWGKRTIFNKEM